MKIIILLLFIIFSININAQIRVEGVVKDIYNEPVSGATVYIDGTFFETDTDSRGNYVLIINGKIGSFNIIAEKKGYESVFKGVEFKKGVIHKIVNLLFTNKINEIDEVTIFSKRLVSEVEVGANQSINELDVLANASDASIITSFNNVNGSEQVRETGELSVRGGSGDETSYFFDGMILRNQLGASVENQGSSFRFSPSLFKNIELKPGGFSVEYGQALSSILTMTSKDISKEKSINVLISPFFIDINSSFLLNKNQSLETNINASDFSLYQNLLKPDLSYLKLDKGPKTFGGNLFYKYKINEKAFLKIFSYVSSAKITSTQEDINDLVIKYKSNVENLNSYNLASFKYDISKKSKLNLGIAYGYNFDQIQTDSLNRNLLIDGLPLKKTSNDFHSKITFKSSLTPVFSIKAGSEFFNQSTSFGSNETKVTILDNLIATYLESTSEIFRNLYMTSGIRYEYSSLTKKNNLAPRFNLSYINKKDQLKISAAYGDFFQQGSAEELLKKPSLNYLKATHQIITIEKKSKNHIYKIDFFNKDYKNLIRNIDEELDNKGSGFAKGFDLLIKGRKVFNKYSYQLTYSYLDTKRLFRRYPVKAPVTFASKHKASLNINRSFFDEAFVTSVTYSYNSGRHYFNPNRTLSEYNQDITNDSHVLNTNLIYSFKIKDTPILLISTVSNILGRKQIFGYEYSNKNFDIRRPISPLYDRFIFVGCYITFGFNKSEEFINNLINN